MNSCIARPWSILVVCTLMMLTSPVVFAQDDAEAQPAGSATSDDAGDAPDSEDAADADDAGETKESANGSYQWKPSWGVGLEAGVFFSDLDRWNENLLDGEPQFDTNALWHFDAAVEASFLEGTRLTVFGGYSTPFSGNPSIGAWYVGLEPAFAFRRDMWEMAIGVGAAMGATNLSLDSGKGADTTLVLLRPFLEVRRYLNTSAAVYVRGGFNQWLPFNVDTDGLQLGRFDQQNTDEDELDVGGPYLAVGVRFGQYPEHIKYVPDSDEDGFRDDVDNCPDKAEDVDQFEDDDGCPDPDNDGDGIDDTDDQCPDTAEDDDGWKDADGCPEQDDDVDGDGLLDTDDQCPEKPEDKDSFEDADGCPDPDNDGDGIADVDDACPNEKGVPKKDGCPIQRVEITLKKIVINEKIHFELDKAKIQQQSYDLLNEIARVIKDNPRIKKIEIQGHTDHSGRASYNKDLSQRRAQSVYDYLVDKGVADARLTAKGYGESKPLVPLEDGEEESEEAAAKNRRVEFLILEQDEVKKTVPEDEIPPEAADVDPTDDSAGSDSAGTDNAADDADDAGDADADGAADDAGDPANAGD